MMMPIWNALRMDMLAVLLVDDRLVVGEAGFDTALISTT